MQNDGTNEQIPKDVWDVIKELGRNQHKFEAHQLKAEENHRILEEYHRKAEENHRKAEENLRKTEEYLRKSDRKLDRAFEPVLRQSQSVDKINGGFNNQWGKFVEELARGSLGRIFKERGIEFHEISPRTAICAESNITLAQYDLVAVGTKKIVVVEVKTTLTRSKVSAFLKKTPGFTTHFKSYEHYAIYGAVAFLKTNDNADKFAEEKGFFAIKAVGEKNKISTMTNPLGFKPKTFNGGGRRYKSFGKS